MRADRESARKSDGEMETESKVKKLRECEVGRKE